MKKIVLSIAILTSITFSCKNEESLIPASQNIDKEFMIPSTAKIIDEKSARLSYLNGLEDYENLAKDLAKVLSKEAIREKIKFEVQKKFDGDFDILFSNFIKINDNSKSIKDYFSGEKIQNILKNEKLNVSIPVKIENWDTKKQLLVAVWIGADEKNTNKVLAYDSRGKMYLLDVKNEPDVPVIVLGINERMNFEKVVKQDRKSRTSGNYESITWLKCPNLSAIEPWLNGAPELRFTAVVYNDNFSAAFQSGNNTEYCPSRHHASDGYTLALWTSNQNLFRWYFDENHGPDYYLQVIEEDDNQYSSKLSVGVTATTKTKIEAGESGYEGKANFEISYSPQDEVLKGELIHFSHPNVSIIGDGNISFRLESLP